MIAAEQEKVFELSTKESTYAFRVMENGLLEHLYYGEKIELSRQEGSFFALTGKWAFAPGNSICYSSENGGVSAESTAFEVAAGGKGDPREPMVEAVFADGSRTLDFVYQNHEITKGKNAFETLPGSYDEENRVDCLEVVLKDRSKELYLDLFYWVYEDCDVITSSAVLRNHTGEKVVVERLLSLCVDLPQDEGIYVNTFTGAWAREMNRTRTYLAAGKLVNDTFVGSSSNRANPFMMLEWPDTGEEYGPCMGMNLIYSGNHYEAAEVSPYGTLRLVTGISPRGFSYLLEPGETLEAPEAVLSFSVKGRGGMSRNMHSFVQKHIVRGFWKEKERPVLLNSWEAFYFDVQESKLLKLAETARRVGVELFVLDDGWFGERNDDSHSLGDWQENRKKLPGGLKALSEKIQDMGMRFGIWVEPEMVNVDSNLYRRHPDWVLENPGRDHSEGRNQRILDLTNPEVQEFIIEEMSRVFSSGKISYVKWDMNRIVSDAYSQYLPSERQGEVLHRYQIGLHRCMKELTERFPEILFEGCASGGNRFDLGILCIFPQIWASDNTDAICRAQIQAGYSYGYPQSVMGAHVSSCPNHQTLRVTPLETRFAVAAFGVLGYECNLADMKREELDAIRDQITLYKQWRSLFQFGKLYRNKTFEDPGAQISNLRDGNGNLQEMILVSPDGSNGVALLVQRFAIPNNHTHTLKLKGLKEDGVYYFSNRDMKYNVKGFGDLVNTVAPIHIRQDSFLHNAIAKFVKMDGEKEEYVLGGDILMKAGVNLRQPYGGTGYNDQVRYFPDYASRLYFVEEIRVGEDGPDREENPAGEGTLAEE